MNGKEAVKVGSARGQRPQRARRMRSGGSRAPGSALATGLPEVIVGTLTGFDGGAPIVEYPHQDRDLVSLARTTVALADAQVGHAVVLAFEQGDAARPIVVGVLRPAEASAETTPQRLVLTAGREVVLRSGKASLTLTRDGRVIIQGEYLVSRASGVNRIQGGSVQIN